MPQFELRMPNKVITVDYEPEGAYMHVKPSGATMTLQDYSLAAVSLFYRVGFEIYGYDQDANREVFLKLIQDSYQSFHQNMSDLESEVEKVHTFPKGWRDWSDEKFNDWMTIWLSEKNQ